MVSLDSASLRRERGRALSPGSTWRKAARRTCREADAAMRELRVTSIAAARAATLLEGGDEDERGLHQSGLDL